MIKVFSLTVIASPTENGAAIPQKRDCFATLAKTGCVEIITKIDYNKYAQIKLTQMKKILGFSGIGMMGTDSGPWDGMGYMMQGSGLWGTLYLLLIIIWGVVGVLAAVWLWKQINKDK